MTGHLNAGKGTRVQQGWGYTSVKYSATTMDPGGKFRCDIPVVPWPISSGNLPASITLRVVGRGDLWLFSPVETTYVLLPVGP
jgi:hypothetical protein